MSLGKRRAAAVLSAVVALLAVVIAVVVRSGRTEPPCASYQSLGPVDFCGPHPAWITPSLVTTQPVRGGPLQLHDLDDPTDPATGESVTVVRAIGAPLVVKCSGTECRIQQPRAAHTVATVPSPVGESSEWWERWLTGTDDVSLAMIRFASANPAGWPKEVASLVGPIDGQRSLALCGAGRGVACTVELHGEGAPAPVEVRVLGTSGPPGDLWSARMVRPGEALLAYAHGGCVVDSERAALPGVRCVDASDKAALEAAEAALERTEVSAVPGYHRYASPLRRQTRSPDGTMIGHFDTMYWVECDHRRADILKLGASGSFCDEGAACIFWADQNLVIELPEVAVMLKEERLRRLCRSGRAIGE
jgi:hypothetical protein